MGRKWKDIHLWGKRKYGERLTVDFCAGCRSLSVLRLLPAEGGDEYEQYHEDQMPPRPLSQRQYWRKCRRCGLVTLADTLHLPAVFRETDQPAIEVIAARFPNLRTQCAADLAREARRLRAPESLSPQERRALIASVVCAPEQELALLCSGKLKFRTYADKKGVEQVAGGVAKLVMEYTTPVLVVAALAGARGWSLAVILSSPAVSVLCWIAQSIYYRLYGWQKYARGFLYPRMARALRPLRPTEEEVRAAFDQLAARLPQLSQRQLQFDAAYVIRLLRDGPYIRGGWDEQ